MVEITFFVKGMPATKGSMTPTKTGKMYHTDPGLKLWEAKIKRAAELAKSLNNIQIMDHPVRLNIFFQKEGAWITFESHEEEPINIETKKDIDKLSRSVLDALQGILYKNDVQVYKLSAEKQQLAHCDLEGHEDEEE